MVRHSLYGIDRIIKEKRQEGKEELKEIRETLLAEYHDIAYVFSERESDTLPPHREGVDRKTKLDGEITLRHCPLYK